MKTEEIKMTKKMKKELETSFKSTLKTILGGKFIVGRTGFVSVGILKKPDFHLVGYNTLKMSFCGLDNKGKSLTHDFYNLTLDEAIVIRKLLGKVIRNYRKYKKGKLKNLKNKEHKLYRGINKDCKKEIIKGGTKNEI